ncbi:MAG TPA: TIGR02594 family protein [Pseudolabrys sp.]|nr:TIGR02594 family protein [Pseudolabrys sp.]
MRLGKRRATILLCSAAAVAFSTAAFARPVHKAAHRHHVARAAITKTVKHHRHYAHRSRQKVRYQVARSTPVTAGFSSEALSSNALVSEARKYLGTNPTGWKKLWCGAFMDMVLRNTGHKGGSALAKDYAHYGPRVNGPQVGAIAVLSRKGGGHVGVVSGVDANGNPIVVSGNHGRKVAESVYPKSRVIAYVNPDN